MKVTFGILGAVAVVAATLGGFALGSDSAAVAVTGCLRTGSAGTVHVLRSATVTDVEGPARDYLLVSVAEGIDLGALLNRQVAVEGEAYGAGQGPEPPPGANTVERALRRLSVQSARQVADACSAG